MYEKFGPSRIWDTPISEMGKLLDENNKVY